MQRSIFNPELLQVAKKAAHENLRKQAFVDGAAAAGGDPMAGGGAPPAGDPMAGPMPAMAPGDPAAAGGAPPADPAAGGGGGGDIQMMIHQAVQQAMAGMGGGAGGAGGVEPIKPKIDPNVTMLQILKILARLADAQGVQIPASEMVATQNDLTQMGMQGEAGAAGGGAPPTSAIAPPEGIQPAMPMPAGGGGGEKTSSSGGRAVPQFADMRQLSNRAGALAAVLRRQTQSAY